MGWTMKKYAVLMSGSVALVVIAWVGLLNYESVSQGFNTGMLGKEAPVSQDPATSEPLPQVVEPPEVIPLGTPVEVRYQTRRVTTDQSQVVNASDGHAFFIKVDRSQVVNSLDSGDTLSSPVEAGDGKLVVVYLTFTNASLSVTTLPQTRFRLIDSQGRQYNEVHEGRVSVLNWLSTQGLSSPLQRVLPGHSAKTAQVFRVAADASNLKLVVDDTLLAIQ
jgi:hypothetical protein